MNPSEFVDDLCAMAFEDTFNPYADRCPVYDSCNAPQTRAKMLLAILESAIKTEVDSIWIGRDLGYRGGRRTGLALTDDIHIETHTARWGISTERATNGQAIAERTAAVIWRTLSKIESPIFLWNVFPLHPHESDDPFSNRAHNSLERCAGEEVLVQLLRLLRPRRLIAIGNDAGRTAERIFSTKNVIRVRHPSYGGQTQFIQQIEDVYGLRASGRQAHLF